MPPSCTVLIASADLLPALIKRVDTAGGELLTFPHTDALRALETIVVRRPAVVALERLFAATPRGAALINRIKADPGLVASEIRVVSHDTDYMRVSRPATTAATEAPAADAPEPIAPPEPNVPAPASTPSLDWRGTRRVPRFRIAGTVTVLVDGNEARLLNLSTMGALVLSSAVLKPNQRVRVTLPDDRGAIRVSAAVIWALFEIPGGQPRYRAGLEFSDQDQQALAAFCARYGQA